MRYKTVLFYYTFMTRSKCVVKVERHLNLRAFFSPSHSSNSVKPRPQEMKRKLLIVSEPDSISEGQQLRRETDNAKSVPAESFSCLYDTPPTQGLCQLKRYRSCFKGIHDDFTH